MWADRVSSIFVDWFTSPWAFVQGIVFCLLWLPFVFIWHIDNHGFWLLFWLTVFSGVTQFPLAYAARQAATAAEKDNDQQEQMLTNQADMMRMLLALSEEIKRGQDEQDAELAAVKYMLGKEGFQ